MIKSEITTLFRKLFYQYTLMSQMEMIHAILFQQRSKKNTKQLAYWSEKTAIKYIDVNSSNYTGTVRKLNNPCKNNRISIYLTKEVRSVHRLNWQVRSNCLKLWKILICARLNFYPRLQRKTKLFSQGSNSPDKDKRK